MKGMEYIKTVTEIITHAWEEQEDIMHEAARKIADTIINGRSVYVFGCSHANILAEEVVYRAGGLATINPIMFSGFMLNNRPITITSKLERLPGLAKILLSENHIKKDDLLILHSVSGRNIVPVEMAIEAKSLGVFTICITNLTYSSSVQSRHESGKRLFEVCDIVIDNGGAIGDAAVNIPGLREPIGPTSTTVGTALINALMIEVAETMLKDGVTPPIFLSANMDNSDSHNQAVMDKYKDQISYL